MSNNRRDYSVRADYRVLAAQWQRDDYLREETYRRVRALHSEGYSMNEVARRVGLSSRGVGRILAR